MRPEAPQPADLSNKLLSDLLAQFNNPPWDIFLIGDGSGTGWGNACGWASILISRLHSHSRRVFYGAADNGSINYAESQPYLQALSWYDAQYGRAILKRQTTINVLVLTDSQTVANWGARACSLDATQLQVPRAQFGTWCMFQGYRNIGYRFDFRWAPRMSSELNRIADLIAGLSRKAILNVAPDVTDLKTYAASQLTAVTFADGDDVIDVYRANPG